MCTSCEPTVGRRSLLRGALAASAGLALSPATASAAPAGRRPAGVRFRWLGVAGWELCFDNRRVLVDPYLSRFRYLKDGKLDPAAPLTVNLANLAQVTTDPTPVHLILVTHGHWDHMADVPELLRALPSARVMGTETHRNLLRAMGSDPSRMIDARGGEYLAFPGFTVQAIRSLHGTGATHQYFAPGTHLSPPPRPATIADLVEGGTLAYRVDIGDRLSAVFIGTAAFAEPDLRGHHPDVAFLSLTGGTTYQFVERVLATLGYPRFVVPSHHDLMDSPLGSPGVDPALLRDFRAVVARVSPGSTVVEPSNHLVPFTL
ncbi:L-ascorbate metabolism protein UlaG (beta-lactamase superfamily) [Crossiella equi]|uniref:L-ascorbate metabolism protein UlaG (Beta-lactamase superfamily) n=1 Tax=Crossiella equi TaxID=130796 RepID=A0ABS5AQE7_9PSEU|nr:MBL fold metallo-hydrolase [Crossiella equi]MBP2478792.1 L-ascorbate metabolism protein UlaG (beta-lactamase superfamily) [Crossiella equi]